MIARTPVLSLVSHAAALLIVISASRCFADENSADSGRVPGDRPRIAYAIAIHGGAGVEPSELDEDRRAAYEKSLAAALREGQEMLADGGTALDAVERVIRLLEDDPLFNAGRGAVFNSAGGHELDASI